VVRSFDHSCPLNKPRKFGFFSQLLAWVPTSDTLMFEPLNLNPSPHVVLWRPGGADRIHQQPPCRPGEVHQFKTQPTDHVLGTKQQLHISNRHKQTALREKLILQTHQYEQSPLYNRMINIYFRYYIIYSMYTYTNINACMHACRQTDVPTWHTYIPTYLPTYPPTYTRTYVRTFIHT
jgi:hypothetical protein